MTLKFILPALLLMCSILSCSTDENQDNQKIEINEDLVLEMRPVLGLNKSRLNFLFSSHKFYECDNVGFLYTSDPGSANVQIHLLGVQIPNSCTGGYGQAVEQILVPSEEGTYSITIDIGQNIHNTGLLINEANASRLYMNTRFGMSMPHDVLLKIPEGTIWGYVGSENGILQNEAIQLVNQHLQAISTEVELAEGYYGYFTNSGIFGLLIESPEVLLPHSFAYHLNTTVNTLEQQVMQIRDALPSGILFRLFTWQGEVFAN